jgi:Tol biopolymer transport system component
MSASLADSSAGAPSGVNGQIAFGNGGFSLFVANADGSGERKIVKSGGRGVGVWNPDWSPDGSSIAFDRRSSSGRGQIWTVRSDGSGARRIGPCCDDRTSPAWSPDGKTIAFVRSWGGVKNDYPKFSEIYVMSASGSGTRAVTHVTGSSPYSVAVGWFGGLAWAPDGKQLVFEVHNSALADPPDRSALFTIDLDGSGMRQITPWDLNGAAPDWSPAARLIVFRSVSPTKSQHGNLYIVRPNGSGLRQITQYDGTKAVGDGSFSPDGRWIIFSRFVSNDSYPGLFVIGADGHGLKQIGGRTSASDPDWGTHR